MSDQPHTSDVASVSRPKWVLPLISAGIIALIAATNVGNVVWASWGQSHPIRLLALNSTNKYLLGTSIYTDFWPFLIVGTIRLLAADPLFYLLGYLYRGQALGWSRRVFPGIDPLVDQFQNDETTFKKALNFLVVIAPNNPICLLAGVAGMPVRRFVVLNVIGTVGRVLLIRQIGFLFEDQIKSVMDTVTRYQGWFLRGSIILVLAYLAWQFFGNRGLVGGVESLEEELGDSQGQGEGDPEKK